MRSVMQHDFSRVPNVAVPRSSFNRSHGVKTTFDGGYLVPIFVDEALPGDTFHCRLTAFARMATPIHPLMDNLRLDTFFFAVPLRLLWENWEKFMGAQDDPGDSIDFNCPYSQSPVGGYATNSLQDYLGLPTLVAGYQHNTFATRAYNLIYNDWFRDQNLQDSVRVDVDGGPDADSNYVLLRRGKRHDYFTSALPWPQKGDAVVVPLGDKAPVEGLGANTQTYTGSGTLFETGQSAGIGYSAGEINSSASLYYVQDPDNSGFPGIYANLADATASTINQLRQAFQVQKLMERDARGGTRYVEIIKSHFGVTSPDFRLQRPEYLGGGSQSINITPVPQTSSTDGTSPQGNLSGFGTSVISGHGFSKSFTEHCIIIGLANVRADLTYQQGLPRMYSRDTRYDFYWPSLAQIGEQAILNKEIYTQATTDDDAVFGYQERYAEYRYKPSLVTGQFRSNATGGSLDAWHLSQDFSSLPVLNASFIEDNPPISRVVAVTTEPEFLFDGYFDFRCVRPMPMFGVPGFIDHF